MSGSYTLPRLIASQIAGLARLSGRSHTVSPSIVLTGFSQDPVFLPYFFPGKNLVVANAIPALATYSVGYLAAGSVHGAQIGFFAPG